MFKEGELVGEEEEEDEEDTPLLPPPPPPPPLLRLLLPILLEREEEPLPKALRCKGLKLPSMPPKRRRKKYPTREFLQVSALGVG